MSILRTTTLVLFWIGTALLAGAVALLLAAQTGPGEGFRDLAAFAGALLLTSLAGLALGGHLLAARAARLPTEGWRLSVAVAGAVLGLAAALWMGYVALDAPNVGLLAFCALVLAAAAAGLASRIVAKRV